MKIAKRTIALLLAMVMVFGLVACSGKSKAETKPVAEASANNAGNEKTPAETTDTGEKVVKIMSHRAWTDTIPLQSRAGNIPEWYWGNMLMSQLYYYGGELEGELAETYELDESAMTITFKLREGIKFSNGADLTAEDAAFTYQLHLDNPTAYNKTIIGFIDHIEVIDDLTVVFYMSSFSPLMWDAFCKAVPILDKETYEADPDAYIANPIGTSGWILGGYDVTSREYWFERWDESWWWDWTGYSSNVDKLHFIYNTEETSRVAALRAGEVDVAESISIDSVSILEDENFHVQVDAAVNHTMMGFNTHEGAILADVKLREAVCRAIDKQAIVDSLLGGKNYVYTWPCEAGKMGYVESDAYSYDPVRAAQLVSEAGYNGETLEMIVCNSYVINAEECAQAIQAYLQAAGLNVNVSVLESGTYEELKKAGQYDINFTDLGSGVSEGLKFVYEIYTTDSFNTGYIDHDNDLYELGEILYSSVDDAVQKEKRTELFTIMAEKYAPYILLWSDNTITASTKNIQDIVYLPTTTGQFFYAINVQ